MEEKLDKAKERSQVYEGIQDKISCEGVILKEGAKRRTSVEAYQSLPTCDHEVGSLTPGHTQLVCTSKKVKI